MTENEEFWNSKTFKLGGYSVCLIAIYTSQKLFSVFKETHWSDNRPTGAVTTTKSSKILQITQNTEFHNWKYGN